MIITRAGHSMYRPRVAFIGADSRSLHLPLGCDWGETSFFAVRPDGSTPALLAARDWGPEYCFLFDLERYSPDAVAGLPGVKVGVLTDENDSLALHRLQERGGLLGFTQVDGASALPGLSYLQVLPLPIDLSRVAPPHLDEWSILVPAWARPEIGPELARAAVTLPSASGLPKTLELLGRAGILLYRAEAPLGRLDPLPLLAMAAGLLVISDRSFPQDWGIEPWEEFLPIQSDRWESAVRDARTKSVFFRTVRIRARQRIEECFSASSVFQRLIHDLRLFSESSRVDRQPRKPSLTPAARLSAASGGRAP